LRRTHARASSTTRGYAEEAAAASLAMDQLTPASKRCLDAAQAQSRRLDDNHVGTEHIVLGVLATDREIAEALARVGVTGELFRAQPFDEPGPSPKETIPLTSRAR
jgi:ATP-dependent Clp protease ATP-binding subunit ClpC